jgi:Fe-S cluster assembly protein SufD
MSLKDTILASFIAFENKESIDVNSKIHQKRREALKQFEAKGFPTKKEENWKYTSLKSVLKQDYTLFPKGDSTLSLDAIKKHTLEAIDSYKIVFVNGVFSASLSDTYCDDGLEICALSSALKKAKYEMVFDHYFDTITDKKESITHLNTAFAHEGAFIQLPKNLVLDKPVQLLYFNTATAQDVLVQPRNLIIIGENSHINIIEKHYNLTNNAILSNIITELFAHKRAIVHYNKLQDDTATAALIDSTFVSQKTSSIVTVNTFSFGGKFVRNNLEFNQNGEHCDSILNGLAIIDNKQFVDNHTLVNHNVPNCESHEMYKGIYNDKATGVFNGRVIVAQAAQKTNAFQQNNNILLSDNTSVYAKPQLEIFADDVKCSHGCTIGQLDDSALFYMQQRGIPKDKAKALLLYAFANENVAAVKLPVLRDTIMKIIATKLGVTFELDI